MSTPSNRVGLLSDSHGRRERTARAVEVLRRAGATLLIHLGDVEDPELLEELLAADLDGRPIPVHLVAGNMDDPAELRAASERLGIRFHHPGGEIVAWGKRIAFTHGDRDGELRRLHASRPDLLAHGHTHVAADQVVDGVRIVNPGALHRARRYTVAVFEPATGVLETIEIPDA